MQRLLTLAAVLLFTANSAWALSCVQPRPMFWSGGETISAQPYLVLENETLEAAWFMAGEARVDATVTTVGAYQVIRPKAPLAVGQTYTLGGKGKHRFAKGPWRWVDNKQVPVTWTVKADQSAAPTWTGDIALGKSSARQGGWGPTSSQELLLSFNSSAPVIAEVKLTRNKAQHTLLLPVAPGKPLRFGQGLCDGEVQLIGHGAWRAEVTLIGPSGQRSKAQATYFTTPQPNAIGR